MTALYLAFLVGGLVLGVYAMLYGTERRVASPLAPHERRSEHDPAAEPSALLNRASVAALAFGVGLAGSLAMRYAQWHWGVVLLLALLSGGAAYMLQAALIARWAIPSARRDAVDERFLLQGTLAKVVDAAPAEGLGRLVYALDGREFTLPVRALDGRALTAGLEVVIDRIEAGIAWAEPWALVEQRL
ncbi:MAG: hypothetical protein LCH84_09405 [Gemmatimonadetes bacterium]|nr:hypothetical protein [Gemmatimonadota bacterium]